MKPTPESLAALRESADMLAAVVRRAAKCDHLEARNKHLQEHSDAISDRHGNLQAVICKAVEGLGNAMPECRGMSLPDLVSEAVSRLEDAQKVNALLSDHLVEARARLNRAEERANACGLQSMALRAGVMS